MSKYKNAIGKNNKKIIVSIISMIIGILLLPILSYLLLYGLIGSNDPMNVFIEKYRYELFGLCFAGFGLVLFTIFSLNAAKLKHKDVVANSRFATEEEQKEFFGIASIDLKHNIENSGSPINMINENELLYEKKPIHSLCIATTGSGKSRKDARQLIMLAIKAEENMVINDPKKEMYYQFKTLLEEEGYSINLLEFRNFEYSDCWNPLQFIINSYNENRLDDMDEYIENLVDDLVDNTSNTEPIWIEGQKALIKSVILLVVTAPMDDAYKNMTSVQQIMQILNEVFEEGICVTSLKNKFSELCIKQNYSWLRFLMDSLELNNLARIAYATIKVSPEKTRGSFFTCALASLRIFGSKKVSRILGKSDFTIDELVDDKTKSILFVVNPDEKSVYNPIASILYSQIYNEACRIANKKPNSKLVKRLNMIFDEFGNMPKLSTMKNAITVGRSRNIIYYLYIQDFSQMDELYGKEIAKIIRANCNIWKFIASSDTETCKAIEEKIGYEDKIVESCSNQISKNGLSYGGGSVSLQHQKIPLINYNDLMSYDNQEGDRVIVLRTYMNPITANLPDVTRFKWQKYLHKIDIEEEELRIANKPDKNSETLWAMPKYYIYKSKFDPSLKFGLWCWTNTDDEELVSNYINSYMENQDINNLIDEENALIKLVKSEKEQKIMNNFLLTGEEKEKIIYYADVFKEGN